MDEFEKSELEKFNENELLMKAIRKVFESVIYDKPFEKFNYDGTNEQLGEDLRAFKTALNIIERGFKELETYKKTKVAKDKTNDAI